MRLRPKLLALVLTPVLLLVLWASTMPAMAKATDNPVELLTGTVWMQSGADVKEAFIFGVECTIAIEQYVEEELDKRAKKKGKKTTFTVSPFDKAWKQATKDMSRADIVKQIDAWYATHPGKQNRLVFDVIWEEIIAPKTAQR